MRLELSIIVILLDILKQQFVNTNNKSVIHMVATWIPINSEDEVQSKHQIEEVSKFKELWMVVDARWSGMTI